MVTKNLHIIGIDPGGTTGFCRLTVPRYSIFGDEPARIEEWDYGELAGLEPRQATELAVLAREVQGLDYKTGPALMCEAWDQDPSFESTDPEALSPARIGAMLTLLQFQGKLNDSTLHFQSRTFIRSSKAVTDDRLRKMGLYVPGSKHIQDATKHAIIGLRRAAESRDFALQLWPYPPNGVA